MFDDNPYDLDEGDGVGRCNRCGADAYDCDCDADEEER